MANIYPVNSTNDELKAKAAALSTQIQAHDNRKDNFENLIRDSVLFNVTYIELQNRAAAKTTDQMKSLTWVSVFVAFASLIVAWLSYAANNADDAWKLKQLELLKTISEQTKSQPLHVPVVKTKP